MLSQWVGQTEFPWLMSNVLDNETGRPLGEGRITHVVHWAGKQIGLLGLVEQEWLETLATINPEEVTFLDFVEAGKKLAAQLKQEVRLKPLEIDIFFFLLRHTGFGYLFIIKYCKFDNFFMTDDRVMYY